MRNELYNSKTCKLTSDTVLVQDFDQYKKIMEDAFFVRHRDKKLMGEGVEFFGSLGPKRLGITPDNDKLFQSRLAESYNNSPELQEILKPRTALGDLLSGAVILALYGIPLIALGIWLNN